MSKGLLGITLFTNVHPGRPTVLRHFKFTQGGGKLGEGSTTICPRANKGGVYTRNSEQRAICLSPMSVCSNVKEREG